MQWHSFAGITVNEEEVTDQVAAYSFSVAKTL
jgi:hypothetical protein